MKQAPVFDEIYKNYLAEVAAVDLTLVSRRLGIQIEENKAVIPFFGIPHRVSGEGITNAEGRRPIHAVSVILCKYLLLCPEAEPAVHTEWVKYHSYKDAAPFAGGFRNTAEMPIAKTFSGRLEELKIASNRLDGVRGDARFNSDLAVRFPALPKLNLLMLFNDQDEEFSADCSILFEKHANAYLDMECLAMLGMMLAVWLKHGPGYNDGNI